MAESSIQDWLDLWHRLLDQPTIPLFKSPDDMAGVLADLRRHPDRLAEAFAPLPCGDEVLARVKFCIESERHHEGMYLVPDVLQATDDELRALVNDALARGCQSCGIEVPAYPINIIRRAMTNEEIRWSGPILEELGDLYIKFAYDSRGLKSEAMQFLKEALYTLAASFEVKGYCLTPLCPDEIQRIDPYKPQVELWLRGALAVARWDDSDRIWIDVFVDS